MGKKCYKMPALYIPSIWPIHYNSNKMLIQTIQHYLQLLCLRRIRNRFTCLFESKLVKQEVSCTVMIRPLTNSMSTIWLIGFKLKISDTKSNYSANCATSTVLFVVKQNGKFEMKFKLNFGFEFNGANLCTSSDNSVSVDSADGRAEKMKKSTMTSIILFCFFSRSI